MTKMLLLGILVFSLQAYQTADTSKTVANILLSNENANSFLQTKIVKEEEDFVKE